MTAQTNRGSLQDILVEVKLGGAMCFFVMNFMESLLGQQDFYLDDADECEELHAQINHLRGTIRGTF